MNVRAATLFFWGFLMGSAALVGEDCQSEIKNTIDSDTIISSDAAIHGEHEVIVRKEIEKMTN
jgi:hypothetical protein